MFKTRSWSGFLVAVAVLLSMAVHPKPRAYAQDYSRNPGDYHAAWVTQNSYPTLQRGGCYRFVIQFRNVGTAVWHQGIVNLGTDRPRDRIPGFIREDRCSGQPSGWISGNRVALQERSVSPGGMGTFVFWYTVTRDHASGIFKEYFRPVADGITWMEDCGCYWDVTVIDRPRFPDTSSPPPPSAGGDQCGPYYGQGYCTDYIRTKMTIPWRGNAIEWFDQANSRRWRTGREPKVGSIAVFAISPVGHVGWVESVSPDGQLFVVSQWNYSPSWRPGTPSQCFVTANFGVTTTTTWRTANSRIRGFIYGP